MQRDNDNQRAIARLTSIDAGQSTTSQDSQHHDALAGIPLSLDDAARVETWCQEQLAKAADLWTRADDLERQAAWVSVVAQGEGEDAGPDPHVDEFPSESACLAFVDRRRRAAADLMERAVQIEQQVSDRLAEVQAARRTGQRAADQQQTESRIAATPVATSRVVEFA